MSADERVPPDLLSTMDLLRGAKGGNREALEALLARYRPRLERWASGRLPGYARSLFDTGDLVQETLLKALERFETFEVRPGGFEAYVRQAVLNRVRDQIRWARNREGSEEISDRLPDPMPSPLENAIGADMVRQYEAAMAQMSEEERQLLHLRIELDLSYEEITAMLGRPNPNATRVAIQRALHKLGQMMGRGGLAGPGE